MTPPLRPPHPSTTIRLLFTVSGTKDNLVILQNPGPQRTKRFIDQYQRMQNGGNKTFRPHEDKIGNALGGEVDPRFESQEDLKYLIGLENA